MDEGASLFLLWVRGVGGPALKYGVDACSWAVCRAWQKSSILEIGSNYKI